MSVRIYIHPNLFGFTDQVEIAEVSGGTVGECIRKLIQRFPALQGELLDKQGGKVLSVFDIWVNGVSAFPEELAKRVSDGDEIYITMVIADG